MVSGVSGNASDAVRPSSRTPAKKTKTKSSPKKKKTTAAKKAVITPSAFKGKKPPRPSRRVMILDAIVKLKERHGSSIRCIKKFIEAAYGVDGDAMLPDIRKILIKGLSNGTFIQPTGSGLTGTFTLADSTVNNKGIRRFPKTKAKNSTAVETPTPKKKNTTPAKKKSVEILQMVLDAILALEETNGSTAAGAIKKFIVYAHGTEMEKPLIDLDHCLKAAVISGVLVQSGNGNSCTYSIGDSSQYKSKSPSPEKPTPKEKTAAKKSPAKKKTPKKSASKAKKTPAKLKAVAKKTPVKPKRKATKKTK